MRELPPEELAEKLLEENDLCTLATASSDGKPEAATVQFTADSNFNLFFETFPSYRKYSNLKSNPRASVVVTEKPHTVQMDGEVEELEGKEFEKARQMIIEEHGEGSGYLEDAELCLFRFEPDWIRVLMEAGYPPEYEMVKGKGDTELH